MPRDKASNVVGDLLEDAQSRGSAWFWQHLVATALRVLLSDLARTPVRLFVFAILGDLALLLVEIVIRPFLPLMWPDLSSLRLALAGFYSAIPFLTSLALVASFGRGRELAFGLALAMGYNWPAYAMRLWLGISLPLYLPSRCVILLAALLLRHRRIQQDPVSLPKRAR